MNRTTALTAAGLLLVALPLAACTSSKPAETASQAPSADSPRQRERRTDRPRIVDCGTSKGE